MYEKKQYTEKQLEAFNAGKLPLQCQETVFGDRMWEHRCQKNATVERDGTVYCSTHDPVRVKQRRADRDKKWEDAYKRKEEQKAQRKAVFVQRIIATTTERPAAALVDEILHQGWAEFRSP